jgi:hypothetical protein
MHMTVKLGVVTLIRKTVDFCEELKGTSLECPVQKGPIKFVKTFDLPQELPKVRWCAYKVEPLLTTK